MEFVFLTYLSTISDSLKKFFGIVDGWLFFLGIASVVIFGIVVLVYAFDDSSAFSKSKREESFDPSLLSSSSMLPALAVGTKTLKILLIGSLVTTIIYCAVPNKKDIYVVMGGYVVTKAAESETAKSLGAKSLAAIERWLTKQISDGAASDQKKSTPEQKK